MILNAPPLPLPSPCDKPLLLLLSVRLSKRGVIFLSKFGSAALAPFVVLYLVHLACRKRTINFWILFVSAVAADRSRYGKCCSSSFFIEVVVVTILSKYSVFGMRKIANFFQKKDVHTA